jgi:hypothetical protein
VLVGPASAGTYGRIGAIGPHLYVGVARRARSVRTVPAVQVPRDFLASLADKLAGAETTDFVPPEPWTTADGIS